MQQSSDSATITEVYEVPPSGGRVIEETQIVRTLTAEEDTFALGVIEYGGNLRKAYEEAFGLGARNPLAKARELLNRPEVAFRIRDITEVVQENALVSLGSHLMELADIRDLAKSQGALKVALNAEEARGRVAGFYIGKEGNSKGGSGKGGDNPMVMISISTSHDRNI